MDENLVETIEMGSGYILKVYTDDNPVNPREEWDNLGTLVCFHSRYDLGDKHHFRNADKVMEHIKDTGAIWLPVYMYEHSGIALNTTGFRDPWDSGQVGVIFVEREEGLKEYSCKIISAKTRRRAIGCLEADVAVYGNYVNGYVFGYNLLDKNGESVDSCWGYYGSDNQKSGLMDDAQENLAWHLKKDYAEVAVARLME